MEPTYVVPEYTEWERMNMGPTKGNGQRQRRLALLFIAEEAGFTHAQIGKARMRIATAIRRVRRQASIPEQEQADALYLGLKEAMLRQSLMPPTKTISPTEVERALNQLDDMRASAWEQARKQKTRDQRTYYVGLADGLHRGIMRLTCLAEVGCIPRQPYP